MHVLDRYVRQAKQQTELDRRMAKALDEIPGAREQIAEAVKVHQPIPLELKRRSFSPVYLDLPLERPIDVEEAASIVERAQLFRNRPVAELAAFAARAHIPPKPVPTKHDPCCCAPESPPSDPKPPPPRPNQYELTFAKLYCVDESDPEWLGSDE
ncbi:MAG: hypothetical protein ABI950_05575, partial [Solirubrobacteraceae bacterium]